MPGQGPGRVVARPLRPAQPVRRALPSPRARDLALVGFAMTGVAFGPARMGFGLFLPQLREAFGFDAAVAGFLATGLFASFTLSALATGRAAGRWGPRPPVLIGGLLATIGLLLVATAPNTPVLALGLVVAGASPGLCWSPFNDAATRELGEHERPAALSAVSTGTTVGVLLAGLLAGVGLVSGLSWRWSWLLFAAAGGLAVVLARRRMPSCGFDDGPADETTWAPAFTGQPSLVRPTVAAASFGLTSSLYLAFAGDRATDAGGLGALPPELASPALFVTYGAAGLVGLLAGALEHRTGLRVTLLVIFAASGASLAMLALEVTSPTVVLGSAALQGAAVMLFSAVLAFWTARLRPRSATRAFTVALIALAGGGVVGPALAGVTIDLLGPGVTFAGAGALSVLTGTGLAVRPRRSGFGTASG